MNKFEIKYLNTAKKMESALLTLLEHREFKDISIVEICKEAGVNRTTFYLHYQNIYELLREISDNLVQEFLCGYKEQLTIEDLKCRSADELKFNTPQYLAAYLEFVKKNKTIYKVYMNNYGELNFDYELKLKEFFSIIIEKNGIKDNTVINYMSKFYFSGVSAIVLEWLNQDCSDDILKICNIIALCTKYN